MLLCCYAVMLLCLKKKLWEIYCENTVRPNGAYLVLILFIVIKKCLVRA